MIYLSQHHEQGHRQASEKILRIKFSHLSVGVECGTLGTPVGGGAAKLRSEVSFSKIEVSGEDEQ